MHSSNARKHDILPLEDFATLSSVERLACFCDHTFMTVIGKKRAPYREDVFTTRKALTQKDMNWDIADKDISTSFVDTALQKYCASYLKWQDIVSKDEKTPLVPEFAIIEDLLWGSSKKKTRMDAAHEYFNNAAKVLELNLHAIDLIKKPSHYTAANSHADQVINNQFYYWRLSNLPTYVNYDLEPASNSFSPEDQAIAHTLTQTPLLAEALRIRSIAPGFYQP